MFLSLIRKWLTSIDNALICYSWCVSLLPNGCTLRYKCKFSAGQKLRHRFFGHKSFVKWQVAQLVERRFFLQKPSTGVEHAICSKTSRIWVCCSEFACLNQSVWWWWWLNWVYESLSFALSVQSLSLLAEMACNTRLKLQNCQTWKCIFWKSLCSTLRQWWYKPPKSILLHSTLQSCMAANQN